MVVATKSLFRIISIMINYLLLVKTILNLFKPSIHKGYKVYQKPLLLKLVIPRVMAA